MKKLIKFLTIALVTGACTYSWAVDYANHFYDQRVYRVALGSGTAPSAADMNLIRLHNGDMVLNTDDNCLYIMHATNVYTKITQTGLVTPTSMSGSTIVLASNKVFVGNSVGVSSAQTLSGLFTITTGGVASASTTGLPVTNATVGGAALSGVGVVVTNATVGGAALSGISTVVTNATVGGAALSGVGITVTNVSLSAQYSGTLYDSTGAALTNAVGTPVIIVTNWTLTVETGTPSVSSPTITLQTGTAVVSAPSITLQTGTPAVSTPTITLQTGSFVKP